MEARSPETIAEASSSADENIFDYKSLFNGLCEFLEAMPKLDDMNKLYDDSDHFVRFTSCEGKGDRPQYWFINRHDHDSGCSHPTHESVETWCDSENSSKASSKKSSANSSKVSSADSSGAAVASFPVASFPAASSAVAIKVT